MRQTIYYVIIFIFFLGCDAKHERMEKPKFNLYHRGITTSSDFITYSDYLLIINYENNIWTANELYETGKKYIDSVNQKFTVSEITFLAPNPYKDTKNWNSEIWGDLKKYCVISFGFNNVFKYNVGVPITLNSIIIWKNGVPRMRAKTPNRVFIDSVLNSKIPISN
jgi:hypothetical protein